VEFQSLGSVREVEEYQIDIPKVGVLELIVNPDVDAGPARASLKNLLISSDH
jgi:hypothetical protein